MKFLLIFSFKKVQSFSVNVKTPKSNKKYISIISYSEKIIKILSQKKRSRHIKYVSAPKINF